MIKNPLRQIGIDAEDFAIQEFEKGHAIFS